MISVPDLEHFIKLVTSVRRSHDFEPTPDRGGLVRPVLETRQLLELRRRSLRRQGHRQGQVTVGYQFLKEKGLVPKISLSPSLSPLCLHCFAVTLF